MRPLHDNVWLRFTDDDVRDEGGVLMLSDETERMNAVVVAAGPEVTPEAGVGVGDVVVANVFDGVPVEFEGAIYRSVPVSKLLAVIGPADKEEPAASDGGRKEGNMATKKKGTPAKRVTKGSVKRVRTDSTGKKGK